MKITEPIIKEAQEKMTKAEDSLRRELGISVQDVLMPVY